MDHDQFLKKLLIVFFGDLLKIVIPHLEPQLRLASAESRRPEGRGPRQPLAGRPTLNEVIDDSTIRRWPPLPPTATFS